MESNQKEKSESTKKTNSPNPLGYIIRGALVGAVLGLVLPLTFGLVMNGGKMDDLAFAILAYILSFTTTTFLFGLKSLASMSF